jgi:hypothetical protein
MLKDSLNYLIKVEIGINIMDFMDGANKSQYQF